MGQLGSGEQRSRTVRTGGCAGATTDTLRRIHRGIDGFLGDEHCIPVRRASGRSGDIPSGLNNPIQRTPVDHEILDDWKRPYPPGLDRNHGPIAKASHVKLAGGGSWYGTMSRAIDHQTTGAADPLSTIVVKGYWHLAPIHQAFVDHIQHLEEGHVRADAGRRILYHATRSARAGLAPDAKGELHL